MKPSVASFSSKLLHCLAEALLVAQIYSRAASALEQKVWLVLRLVGVLNWLQICCVAVLFQPLALFLLEDVCWFLQPRGIPLTGTRHCAREGFTDCL